MDTSEPNKGMMILLLTFLILSLASCTGPGPSHSPPADGTPPQTAHKIDTTLRLKFTNGVRSILEDSKGNFWFGSHNEGVALFDGEKITYFTEEDGLSDGQVRTVLEDPQGIIWFEGGRGLSSYDGHKITTRTDRDYSAVQEWRVAPGDLWFKGDETRGFNALEEQPGAYRYDGDRLIFQAFPIELKAGEENYYSVSTPAVQGKNGEVWIGTYGAVIGYDGDAFTIIDDERLGLNETTGFLHVRSLFEDSKGNLWIGNNSIGVLKYDGDTIINFSKQRGLVSYLSRYNGSTSPPGSLEHVFAIAEDKAGNMWFGDRDTGAWKFDGESLKNYTKEDGLPTHHIWAIYRDKRDVLWFALADGSMCRFNGGSFDRIL